MPPRERTNKPKTLWEGFSPWTIAIKADYMTAGLDRWDNQRVFRICELFNCTVEDLCSIAGLFERDAISRYLKENLWPMWLTIQWDRLERCRLRMNDPHLQDGLAATVLDWENKKDDLKKSA